MLSELQSPVEAQYLTQHTAELNGFFNISKASLHWLAQIVAGLADCPSLDKDVQLQKKD
jgi:hypothetical protein